MLFKEFLKTKKERVNMNHNKKANIFFLALFAFFFMCPVVSAEDIYAGENSQYTVYLRKDSIKAEVIIYQGKPVMESNIKFNTIWIPKAQELYNLRKLCLDDRIVFAEEDNRMNLKYNRMTKEWLPASAGVIKDKRKYKSEEKITLFHNDSYDYYSYMYVDNRKDAELYKDIFALVLDHWKPTNEKMTTTKVIENKTLP